MEEDTISGNHEGREDKTASYPQGSYRWREGCLEDGSEAQALHLRDPGEGSPAPVSTRRRRVPQNRAVQHEERIGSPEAESSPPDPSDRDAGNAPGYESPGNAHRSPDDAPFDAKNASRAAETFFAALFRHVPDMVIVLGDDLKPFWISPSTLRNTGYAEGELRSSSILRLLHPEDRGRAMEALYFCAAHSGVPYELEIRFRKRDGSYRYHHTLITNLVQDPAVKGVVVNFRDITDSVHLRGDLIEHRGNLERLIEERTRELEEANRRLLEEVGQRQRLEEELRRREKFYRTLAENAYDMVAVMQPDGRLDYVSPSVKDNLGYDPEELVGKNALEYVHPDDLPGVMELFAKETPTRGNPVVTRLRFKHGDGSWRVLETVGRNLLDDSVVAGVVVNVRDITEQVENEEALRGRDEYRRVLLENSMDIMFIVDENGVFSYVSPSVKKLLGYDPDELVGKSGFQFIPSDELERAWKDFQNLLGKPEEIYEGEFHALHRDGSWREVEVRARDMLDHPLVRGFMVNLHDVTERNVAMRRLELINRLFLSLGGDIIHNMEIIVRGCLELLGGDLAAYCRLERGKFSVLSTAPGEESFQVLAGDSTHIARAVIAWGRKEPLALEELRVHQDFREDPLAGEHGMASFLGYPVRLKGKTIGCLCLYQAHPRSFLPVEVETMGLLARVMAGEEERLAHEQNLKEFIDVASHELRHPVTFMKGYALTLRDYGDRLDEATRREYLEIINQGADRLDGLIRELLDVSRIERGRFVVNRKEQRLEPLLERALREVKAKGASHPLRLNVLGELSPRAVDAEKIVRLMVILLDNAVAHSPAHFPVEVTAEDRNGMALISVLDRGVGVPEEQRELIFERFYQVEDAMHHTTRGMGLGLYIAREIAEAHGGRIWHEHRLGGGSVFRFTLR